MARNSGMKAVGSSGFCRNISLPNATSRKVKTMAFLIMSKRKPGVSRAELVAHLSSRMDPSTWELFRKGKVEHLLFMTGEEPGFLAIVNSEDINEVRTLADQAIARHNLFDLDIVPVNRFPEFSTVATEGP
jgi:hypothetical protein